MEELKIIPLGSRVIVGDGIEACVTAVCLRNGPSVTYECSWWAERNRNEAWFQAFELTRMDAAEGFMRIGFI